MALANLRCARSEIPRQISLVTGQPAQKQAWVQFQLCGVDWVEWEGPLNSSNGTSSELDWWISSESDPDESSRARKILEQFAFRAFRGAAPEKDFIDRLSVIFAGRRKSGDEFDAAIRLPLSIILASPGFLYLNEPSDAEMSVASSRIARSPCAWPTSSGVPRPTRSCSNWRSNKN